MKGKKPRPVGDILNKNILIIGAGSGVGECLLNRLYKDNNIACITRTASKIQLDSTNKSSFIVYESDLGSSDVLNKVKESIEFLKKIDILIIIAGESMIGEFVDYSMDDIIKVVNTNIVGTTLLIQNVIKNMIDNNGGRIVCMSSESSVRNHPFNSIYSSSKAFLDKLVKDLSVELGGANVKINSVAPGIIDTPFLDKIISYNDSIIDFIKSSSKVTASSVADAFIEVLTSDTIENGEVLEIIN